MTHLSERELQLPTLEFPSIFKRVIRDKSIISLGPGEPDFVTPKPLLEYAKKIIHKGTHYSEPQGMLELREAIVKKVRKENHIKTIPENVLVTCGSQEALFSALLTTIDPTEQVIVSSPGYLGYLPAIELVNGVPIFLKLDEKDEFSINPDRLRKLINKKKTKAIIINSPRNPTGTVLSKKILEEIADIAVDNDVYIFSDEAYEKIIYDNNKHVSIGSFNGMEKYVVTFQTFSKSFAMCGFRLGYCIGPEKLMKDMTKVHHYVTLTAPHVSQLVGIKALTLSDKYIKAMVKEYKRRRDMIVKRLNELDMPTPMPGGAFYAFSNIQNYSKNASKFAKMLLDKAKVAVIPGTEFGLYGEGYVRYSFATDYKNIEKAMSRIERVLGKH
ncbi:MAG: pyridoxal phosphate-dependent aminotransferase [Nanoarchaeota archaeon]|nr:pyridoxal phosphate-dependent aminotransferase [Nanoarchaeota archaeon]